MPLLPLPETSVSVVPEPWSKLYAATNPGLLDDKIEEVMEPPFPAVSVDDPVRAAIELLVGPQQALLVTRDGRPEGIVTRTDLLEALAS